MMTFLTVSLVCSGVFILLLLSGERNFGVRLNKPYTAAVPMDISVFSGSHADLLIIVFHKVLMKVYPILPIMNGLSIKIAF